MTAIARVDLMSKKKEKFTERHTVYSNGICYITMTKTHRCDKHNKAKTNKQGQRNDIK